PSVLVNVILANEYQVGWISKLIKHMRDRGFGRVDVDPASQAGWSQTVKDIIKGTVFTSADSWYVGTNVPGKPKGILAYAGGIVNHMKACDAVADKEFTGFVFS